MITGRRHADKTIPWLGMMIVIVLNLIVASHYLGGIEEDIKNIRAEIHEIKTQIKMIPQESGYTSQGMIGR